MILKLFWNEFIGVTLQYFKMAIMPLVPETKMADTRKQSVSGTHWPRELRGQCSKLRPPLQFRPAFLEPTPWQEFSINTLIFQHSFTFPLPERTLWLSFSTNSSQSLQKCIRHANILLHFIPFRWDFFSASKTTEISSNHRKKQTTWEKTCSS